MLKCLILYVGWRYGNIKTNVVTEQYIDEFPFEMEGYNMGIVVPDKYIEVGISPGLLPPHMNEGGVVKW